MSIQQNKKQADDGDYLDSYTLKPAYRTRHQILWVMFVFVIVFLFWSYFATLDEATVSEGEVIPSSKAKILQNLEGGILSKVFVEEGQQVTRGELLMTLDDTRYKAELNEIDLEIDALELQLSRLTAEADATTFIVPPRLSDKVSPNLLERQKQLFNSRQNELKGLETRKLYSEKELNMTTPLAEKGVVSDVEVLHLQQKVEEIQTQINNFKTETLKEYREVKLNLAKAIQRKITLEDRINRASIRSPINGIITQIHIGAAGSVIKSGADILEVVPDDDILMVETHVKPSDIGFIHVGQSAVVKITAFDYSVYGGLKGIVTHVSADSAKDEKGDHYYEVWVKTDQNYIEAHDSDKKLKIKPGMRASVDILTGRKSVMTYFLKPILKAKSSALRER